MRVWLVRIAWNLAIDRRRRIRPEQMDKIFAQSLVANSVPADEALEEAQHMNAVLRELERLPRGERHVLLLSAIEELRTAEMAEVPWKKRVCSPSTALSRTNAAARAARRKGGQVRKNPEEAIERVLAALRDADAPVGIECRILNALDALEDHSSPQRRSGWRRFRPIWLVTPARPVASWFLASGVALAGLFVVAITIPAIRRLGHSSTQAPTQIRTNSVSAAPQPLGTPETAANNAPLPLPGVRPTRKENARRPKGARESDSAVLSEMRSDSFPAPPMPLTEQERLLLRIAHRAGPVELAMLDPMQRAARDAEENADVKKFFEPSATEQSATKP